MSTHAADIAGRFKGTLVETLGIRFTEATADRVVAELEWREALTTVGGSLHGGALMALADTIGAAATILNLPAGATTTTLESKTNFFAAGRGRATRARTTPPPPGARPPGWATPAPHPTGALLSATIPTPH